MPPTLSVCIINHRTAELTRACVQSVFATRGELDIEVLIVNNTNDPCDLAAYDVVFIQNESPLSFAANQNQMLRRAQGQYLMPLNSDTVIHVGALQGLIQFMNAHSRCGVAGPRLVYDNGELQPSCLNFPNFLTQFLESSGRWQHLRGSRLAGYFHKLSGPHNRATQTDWLYGACLMVRDKTLAQVGLFDEVLFAEMYGEDIDWMWRVRKAGWEIWYAPDAVVTHLENQSPLDMRLWRMYQGLRRFVRRHYTTVQQMGVRLGILLGFALKLPFVANKEHRNQYARVLRGVLPGAWESDAVWK